MLLEKLSKKHKADKLDSDLAMHFLEVYEWYFSPIREEKMDVLEIGVHHGGSLKMWEEYFPNSSISGIDIDKKCKGYEGGRVKVFIGDQANREFLKTMGEFNIIIDDGGHTMVQQQASFWELWWHIKVGGYYVMEDLETSYWPQFDGGYRNKGNTMEMLKGLVDNLNHAGIGYSRAKGLAEGLPDYGIEFIHFYPSLCILKKGNR